MMEHAAPKLFQRHAQRIHDYGLFGALLAALTRGLLGNIGDDVIQRAICLADLVLSCAVATIMDLSTLSHNPHLLGQTANRAHHTAMNEHGEQHK